MKEYKKRPKMIEDKNVKRKKNEGLYRHNHFKAFLIKGFFEQIS